MKTSVVIPNFDGEELLKRNLEQVLKIGADEVIIVDDGSTDGSLDFLKKFKDEIKLVRHEENKGFSESANDGFRKAVGEVVILLNTDVKPKPDIIEKTLPHFRDRQVFAVSFNEGKFGYTKGIFHRGLIEYRGASPDNYLHESFWASGGSAAFSKDKWDDLGGMDTLYSPFYWEDVDISYRAQARGWKILWEPKARVEHRHHGTTDKSSAKRRAWIIERNHWIFFWKNVSSLKLWLLHLLWLPRRLWPPGRLVPFFWAVSKIPVIIWRRLESCGERRASDEEILAKFRD